MTVNPRAAALVAAAMLGCASNGALQGPRGDAAFVREVSASRAQGDWARVESLAGEQLRKAPRDAAALAAMGEALYRTGRPAEAAGPLRASLQLDDKPLTHALLGHVLRQTLQPAEAEAQYRAAMALAPELPELVWELAEAIRAQGRFAEAQSVVEAGRTKFGAKLPDDPRAVVIAEAARWKHRPELLAAYARGEALAVSGQSREAVRELRAVLAQAPDFAAPHLALGLALAALGQTDGAEAELRAALDGFGSGERMHWAAAAVSLADLLAESPPGRREARELLRDAVAVSPQPGWLLSLGVLCGKAGDTAGAFEALLRVTRLVRPAEADAPGIAVRDRAAAELRMLGCWSDADDAFDARRCVPRDSAERCRKAREIIFGKAPDPLTGEIPPSPEIIEELEYAVAAAPQHAFCWADLAGELDGVGEKTRAESAYRAALAAPTGALDASSRARIQGALASLLIRSGSTSPEVVQLARQARAALGEDPFHVLVLGRACEVTGDRACAVESFRRILARPDADAKVRSRAAERLRDLGVENVPAVVTPAI